MTDNCNVCVHIVQFWSVIKKEKKRRRIHRLCFVLINSVPWKLSRVWILTEVWFGSGM